MNGAKIITASSLMFSWLGTVVLVWGKMYGKISWSEVLTLVWGLILRHFFFICLFDTVCLFHSLLNLLLSLFIHYTFSLHPLCFLYFLPPLSLPGLTLVRYTLYHESSYCLKQTIHPHSLSLLLSSHNNPRWFTMTLTAWLVITIAKYMNSS